MVTCGFCQLEESQKRANTLRAAGGTLAVVMFETCFKFSIYVFSLLSSPESDGMCSTYHAAGSRQHPSPGPCKVEPRVVVSRCTSGGTTCQVSTMHDRLPTASGLLPPTLPWNERPGFSCNKASLSTLAHNSASPFHSSCYWFQMVGTQAQEESPMADLSGFLQRVVTLIAAEVERANEPT